MDLSTDAESNQQALRSTACTPTGDTTAGADTGSDTSSIGPEIQPCLGASDGELATEATGATSEPDVMIDALSDEESCHGSRKGQDPDHRRCSPSDTESECPGAEYGSQPGARVSPPSHGVLSRRRSRRTSPHPHTTAKDEDSDVDIEGSGSEHGLDVPECIRDEEYCPSPPGVQGYDSGDDSEDEENCRRRRRVSQSSHASTHSTPTSARSSRQRRLTRRVAHSPEEARTPVCNTEDPAPPQATSVTSEGRALLARFEEWPLQDVSLKRITEGGRTTFQLQFEWAPDPRQAHADRSVSHSRGGGPPEASLSGTRSSGGSGQQRRKILCAR